MTTLFISFFFRLRILLFLNNGLFTCSFFFYTFPDLQCVTFSLSGILTSASLEQVHLLDICPGKQHNFTDFTDELHKST